MKMVIPTTITRNGGGVKVSIPAAIARMKKLSIGDTAVIIADDETSEIRMVVG